MRPTLILGLILCAGFAMARAADAQDTNTFAPASQAHRPGRWSMQFQIVQDFQFRGFEGAGLAMTRNAGTNSAWRFGVNLDGQLTEGDRTTTTAADSEFSQDVLPIDRNQYSVRLDLLYLHRYHPARRVGLELGVGPAVDLLRYREEVEQGYDSFTFHRESRASSSSYGITGRLGVEVFLARALSVHAHYGGFFGYQQVTSTSLYHDVYTNGLVRDAAVENQTHQWFLTNEGVSLGISVYL